MKADNIAKPTPFPLEEFPVKISSSCHQLCYGLVTVLASFYSFDPCRSRSTILDQIRHWLLLITKKINMYLRCICKKILAFGASDPLCRYIATPLLNTNIPKCISLCRIGTLCSVHFKTRPNSVGFHIVIWLTLNPLKSPICVKPNIWLSNRYNKRKTIFNLNVLCDRSLYLDKDNKVWYFKNDTN